MRACKIKQVIKLKISAYNMFPLEKRPDLTKLIEYDGELILKLDEKKLLGIIVPGAEISEYRKVFLFLFLIENVYYFIFSIK
jgi:hypothetical protein